MNKIKYIKYILYLIVFLQLISCDYHDTKLVLYNKTNDTVYYDIMYSDERLEWNPYAKKNGKVDVSISQFILPKENKSSAVMGTWEEQIYRMAEDSAIRVYFFKKELVNIDNDSFLKKQDYTKKIKLKIKDLEKIKWKIVYDGK